MARLPVEERRRALVDAAIRVIARDGVSAATTRAIVAEAGMPLGSFHYAFTSRDALLERVIAEVTEQDRVAAEGGALPLAGPSAAGGRRPAMVEVLHAGLDAYVDLLVHDPLREQAVLELMLHGLRTPAFQPAVRAQYAAYHREAATTLLVAAAITRSRWTVPVEQVARALVTVTDGLTTTWLADRDTPSARRTVALAARALAALAAPAGPDEPAPTEPDLLTPTEELDDAH